MADTFKGIITADGKKRQLSYGSILEIPASDETLSIQGAFADSKVVGDKFKEVKAETVSLKEGISENDKLTGYKKVNLLKNELNSATKNGISFAVNADKSITISGTSTALAYCELSCTLNKGNYILTGCNGGDSQSHHIMLIRENGSYDYQFGANELKFNISNDTETIRVLIRVADAGITVNDTVYPMIRNANVYNPTYAPYGEYQIYKSVQELIDYSIFNWSGKKMNVIGDSIVAGSYGNFVNVIRDILQLSVARNYGIGGSLLASSDIDDDLPPACVRYTQMDDDADIIIVHAGTNDYSAQIPLGEETATDITTFNGALNTLMTGLREKYPDKLIIFSNILHRFNDDVYTIKASQYRECIENRCLVNHIVFYDGYKYTGFDFAKGYYDHILTSDGLHPNKKGAEIFGRKLAGFIRWN